MDENLFRAREQYRIDMGLLTAKDIIAIREKYALSQKDFSRLMGWGDVTIGRYEKKVIQEPTYDEEMKRVSEDPYHALVKFLKNKSNFDTEQQDKIEATIKALIAKYGLPSMKKQELQKLYLEYNTESDANGFKLLDIEKVDQLMVFFAKNLNSLYKTKLMKLMFFADALNFKRYGKSMTGLVYTHMPLGALPIGFDELMYRPSINVTEEYNEEYTAYKITPADDTCLKDLSMDEMEILIQVASYFKDFKTKQIIDYCHDETAYTETAENQVIPYSLSAQIREFQ